jgi:hypothetical protein
MIPTGDRRGRLASKTRDQILSYQFLLVYHQDCCVCFEVHPLCAFHNLQAFDSDVLLVGQAETYEIEHVEQSEEFIKGVAAIIVEKLSRIVTWWVLQRKLPRGA